MKTISKNSDQLAGIVKLIAIPVGVITSILSGSVNVSDNDSVYLINCSIDSIQHEDKITDDDNGKFHAHRVTGVIHGSDTVSSAYLNILAATYLVLLLQTDNGSWVRIGEKTNAMSLIWNYSSIRPGYEIEFTGNLTTEALQNNDPNYD